MALTKPLYTIKELADEMGMSKKAALRYIRKVFGIEPFYLSKHTWNNKQVPSRLYISLAQIKDARPDDYEERFNGITPTIP